MKYLIALSAIALAFLQSPAEARVRHHHQAAVYADPGCNVIFPCEGVVAHPRGLKVEQAMGGFGVARKVYQRSSRSERVNPRLYAQPYQRPLQARERVGSTGGSIVGGRPVGCPHAFCGCGASLHVFGRIIPTLNLAANWLAFPRTSPAPGMAAARPGHVFILEQHIEGNVWLVHDSNSGRGLTRVHARSIAGYTVVNPHGGSRYASLN